jgi:hypothetical protein
MWPKRKFYNMFFNVFYSVAIVFLVAYIYYLFNRAANSTIGVEPLLFGTLYMLIDFGLVWARNGIRLWIGRKNA